MLNGQLRCWGRNTWLQLGTDSTSESIGDDEAPAAIGNAPLRGSGVQLTTGPDHSCILLDSAAIKCWGWGSEGRLGWWNGAETRLSLQGTVFVGDPVLQVSAGGANTCVVTASHRVRCWGSHSPDGSSYWNQPGDGRLGQAWSQTNGIGNNVRVDSTDPIELGGLASQVSTGDAHSCALMVNGSVICWGIGSDGRLGHGNTDNIGQSQTPAEAGVVPFSNSGKVGIQVSVGGAFSCVLQNDNTVKCWGKSSKGQLGLGSSATIGDDEPAYDQQDGIALGMPAAQIDCGFEHCCALSLLGEIKCWGSNGALQLGLDADVRDVGLSDVPAATLPVFRNRPAVFISSGRSHTCATLGTGQVRCWGSSADGRLGRGADPIANGHLAVLPEASFSTSASGISQRLQHRRQVSRTAAGSAVRCVTVDEVLACWGDNENGMVGLPDSPTVGSHHKPAMAHAVSVGGPVLDMAVGGSHVCAVLGRAGTAVRCWGAAANYVNGAYAQYGVSSHPKDNGNVFDFTTRVAAIAVGTTSACLMLEAGTVHCWGSNHWATLGQNKTKAQLDHSATPLQVPIGELVGSFGCGEVHCCVQMRDGSRVVCWGANWHLAFGVPATDQAANPAYESRDLKFGDDEAVSEVAPFEAPGSVAELAVSIARTCVILSNGDVSCCGRNYGGELGYDSTDWQLCARQSARELGVINFGEPVLQLAGALEHACALGISGVVKCWGAVTNGRLGTGLDYSSQSNKLLLAPGLPAVPLAEPASSLSCGYRHCCALAQSGKMQCWGQNDKAQLGYAHTNHVGDDELLSQYPALPLFHAELSEFSNPIGAVPGSPEVALVDPVGMGIPEIDVARTTSLASNSSAVPAPLGDMPQAFSFVGLSASAISIDRCFPDHFKAVGNSPGCVAALPANDSSLAAVEVGVSPRLMVTSTGPLSTQGSSPLTITGDLAWIAISSGVGSILVNGQPCERPRFMSLHELTCSSPPGVGSTIAVAVEASSWVGLQLPPRLEALRAEVSVGYAPPSITAVSPPDQLWPGGGQLLRVMGDSFGTAAKLAAFAATNPDLASVCSGSALAVFVGGRRCENATLLSDFEASCVTPALPGGHHRVDLCTAGQSTSSTVSYTEMDVASVQSKSGSLSTAGGDEVRISGIGFGRDKSYIAAVTWDGRPVPFQWESSATLSVTAPAGVGTVLVAVLAGNGYDPATIGARAKRNITYDPPRLVRVEPSAFLAGLANATVTLLGSNLGSAPGDVDAIQVGGRDCFPESVSSGRSVTCRFDRTPFSDWSEPGVVRVAVGGQRAELAVLTLGRPVISGVVATQFPTVGGGPIRLVGDGLGRSRADLLGLWVDGVASQMLNWTSATELSFALPPGSGRKALVELALVSGLNATTVLSYDPPVPLSVQPDSLLIGMGGANVSIRGTGFGERLSEVDWVSVGGIPCLPTWLGRPSAQGRQAVNCTMNETRASTWPTLRSVSLQVNGQGSGRVEGLFTGVPPPVVTTIVAGSLPTSGGERVRLIGDGLGRRRSDIVAVRVGGNTVADSAIEWIAQQEMSFVLPASAGGESRVEVELVSGRVANASITSDPPLLSAAQPPYLLAGAYHHQPVFVAGVNLPSSPAGRIESLLLGGVACDEIRAVDSSGAICQGLDARNGWPAPLQASITVGLQTTSAVGVFEGVGAPLISSVSPVVGDAGETLLLFGSNFGRNLSDISSVVIGGSPCDEIVHKGPQALECVVPPASAGLSGANQSDLQRLPVVVSNAFGLSSPLLSGPVFTYADAYKGPPSMAASELSVWRRSGEGTVVWASWAYPIVPGEFEAPVESFQLRVTAAGRSSSSMEQMVSVRLAELLGDAVELGDGRRLYESNVFALTIHPVTVEVRAVGAGAGPWSAPSAPVAERCRESQFLHTALPIETWQCHDCPDGAYCGAAAAEGVTALAGYWRVPWSPFGLGFTPCEVEEACHGWQGSDSSAERALTPSGGGGSSSFRRLAGAWNASSDSSEGCAPGYYGTKCSGCQHGYARWGAFRCRKCTGVVLVVAVMLLVAVLLVGVITLMVVNAFRAGLTPARGDAAGTRGHANIVIKIAFSHLQTVGIAASFSLKWPRSVERLFAAMSAASSATSEVLALDCVLSHKTDSSDGTAAVSDGLFFARSSIVLATPLILLCVAAFGWAVVVPYVVRPSLSSSRQNATARVALSTAPRPARRILTSPPSECLSPATNAPQPGADSSSTNPLAMVAHPDTHSTPARKQQGLRSVLSLKTVNPMDSAAIQLTLADKLVTSSVVILFLLHMSLTQTSFQLLTCTDVVAESPLALANATSAAAVVPAAQASLVAATSGGCDASTAHRRLLADLEVCCHDPWALRRMYGLAIPGLLLYAFGIPITAAALLWLRSDQLGDKRTKVTLGFLYDGYRPSAYYWESVIMLRKVLVAAIAIFLAPAGVALQTYAALLLIFLLTVLHVSAHPFESLLLNRLELAALVTAFVTFECGLFLTAPEASQAVALVATLVIFAANASFLVAVAVVGCGPAALARCRSTGHGRARRRVTGRARATSQLAQRQGPMNPM